MMMVIGVVVAVVAVTVMDVAQSIGSGLAKATLAGRVNNVLVDASTLIDKDASLQIIIFNFYNKKKHR